MAEEKTLTGKQRLFVEHYLQTWNATESARRAGYAGNAVTLASVGTENLRKPQIAEQIEKRISEVAMSADEVLLRLARHARGNFEPFLYQGKDGEEALPGEAPRLDLSTESARRNIDLVKEIETETTTKIVEDAAYETVKIKVKLYDSQAALVHLGRHHKLFTDKHEIGGLNGKPIQVEDVTAYNGMDRGVLNARIGEALKPPDGSES